MAAITDEEFFELIGDTTQEGTEKLLKKFYGSEWQAALKDEDTVDKVIGSMAEMLWAHIEAPLLALDGDGKGAVDSVVGGIGSLAGGIIGGLPGAIVGQVITDVPGFIIDYFDTSNPQFYVAVTNVSKYHIRFSSNITNYRPLTSIMYANIPGGRNAMYCTDQLFIPKAVTYQKSEDKAEQVIFVCPMTVHSKWAYAGYQLEAVDDDGKVVKTYDIGFKYPGGWWGENHWVGVFENASWPRGNDNDNYDCLYNVGKQTKTGKDNRPSEGTSGESKAWWETWTHCQFELA